MGDVCKDVGLVGVSKEETSRVKLTEVNPHLVCVLCHGYFVDATTITECLHSFCRSCIFRHLEVKSFCPICEVQVHARLHRSLKPDKTLQDIVYKLVPGLFHNEMERRRAFYKEHPFRDEHLEPERRGLGLDRLIYSPTDTISLSLEFYDTEREREEWSSVTCPPPHQDTPPSTSSASNNNNKRYLQCPAIFKMAHLKKFLRQKYNLPRSANVEIIYKREFLPDSYSLMDVAYIYTWKRNGPMRFYYRIPDVIEKVIPFEGKTIQEKQDNKTKSSFKAVPQENQPASSPKSDKKVYSSLERNKQVLSAANLSVETAEKKPPPPVLKQVVENSPFTLSADSPATISAPALTMPKTVTESTKPEKIDTKKEVPTLPVIENSKVVPENKCLNSSSSKSPPKNNINNNNHKEKSSDPTPVPTLQNSPKELPNVQPIEKPTSPKIPKQDELPVEVLLSLSTCRVGKEATTAEDQKEAVAVPESSQAPKVNHASKIKNSSNARMSLNKIASELQQKAANNFIQKASKENNVSPSKVNAASKTSLNSKAQCPNKINNIANNMNGRVNGNKRKSNGNVGQGRHFFNDMGVMDHRIQQLYKFPGSPTGNGVVQVGQKTESRLASWLNNRFQSKPPGSPAHPGITSPTPTLPNALSSQLTVTTKLNGAKPSDNLGPAVNLALHNAINATIKNSTHHNIPPQVGFFNKSSFPTNSHLQSPVPNGKKMHSEKRDKCKFLQNIPNGISVKKDSETLKNISPKSPIMVPQKNTNIVLSVPTKPSSPKVEDGVKNGKLINNINSSPQTTCLVKDQILVIPDTTSNAKDRPKSINTPPSTLVSKSPKPTPFKEGGSVNGEHSTKKSPTCANGSEGTSKPGSEPKQDETTNKPQDNKGDSSKLDEEVNRLKRKLEEMRKMSNPKGKEIGGCQITHENPDPEEAKRRRDITPVVSIELMRGCKRPVPGLKAIQDITDLGKKKGLDEKKDIPEKKPKLSTVKKDLGKKEETCALDLSRCGPPNPSTPPHPWFNPLLHQQFLPSPK